MNISAEPCLLHSGWKEEEIIWTLLVSVSRPTWRNSAFCKFTVTETFGRLTITSPPAKANWPYAVSPAGGLYDGITAL